MDGAENEKRSNPPFSMPNEMKSVLQNSAGAKLKSSEGWRRRIFFYFAEILIHILLFFIKSDFNLNQIIQN